MNDEVRLAMEAAEGDAVALARSLVAIPSVNPALDDDGHGEEAIAHACAGWLHDWGLRTRVVEVAPGRFNVVGELGRGDPVLLLNGHLDTVGVGGMEHDPFDPVVHDGRIYGRGACDMKGGVAALLAASAAVAGSGGPDRGTLVVALTADEEHASLGMRALVEEGIRADGAVVCEPTGLAVMPAHKGFVWMEATFRGKAAHGSRPDIGVDAVRHAALYVSGLEGAHARLAEAEAHELLGAPSFHVGTICGGTAPSVYPAECRLTLERRTLPGEDHDEVVEPFRTVLERLSRTQPDVDAELEVTLVRPGSDVPLDARVVRKLLAALEREEIDARVEGMSAWVDASFLNEAGIPAVCFGPGHIARAHGAQEFLEVEELRAAAWVLERFVRLFLRD